MKKREHRFVPARELRVRRSEGASPVLEGYAVVFGALSQDLGGFQETIQAGAFEETLADSADVRCLFNHDESLILGRTKSKTLTLREDATGLFFSCDLPPTTVANDLAISVERGDVDQCSFGFYCLTDDWKLVDGTPIRTVLKAELFDVSAVTYPAYLDTTCSVRSLWKDGQPASIEQAIRSLQNAPDPQHCDNCGKADCHDPNCAENDTIRRRDLLRLVRASL